MWKKTTVIALIGLMSLACMRSVADRRAVQWSTAIVSARLVSIDDKTKETYTVAVTDSLDGPLTVGQKITVNGYTGEGAQPCANKPSTDDLNKSFTLLLRGAGNNSYTVVTMSPADPTDTSSLDALKDLIQETRKAEASLTDETVKTQALAYANAQDDTEADQAEKELREMGYKAVPMIRKVMADSNDIGKQRLAPVIKDLLPPGDAGPSTQP